MCHKIHRDRSVSEFVIGNPTDGRCVYPVWGMTDRDHTFTQCSEEPKRKVDGYAFCVEHARVVKQVLALTSTRGER